MGVVDGLDLALDFDRGRVFVVLSVATLLNPNKGSAQHKPPIRQNG